MEMTKKELNTLLLKAKKNGFITPVQLTIALKLYKKTGDLSILEFIEVKKAAFLKRKKINETSWNELSDLDALRTIVRQNNQIISLGKSISGWVTFIGVVMIINIIGAIIIVNQM
jgi:hypothetical protein